MQPLYGHKQVFTPEKLLRLSEWCVDMLGACGFWCEDVSGGLLVVECSTPALQRWVTAAG